MHCVARFDKRIRFKRKCFSGSFSLLRSRLSILNVQEFYLLNKKKYIHITHIYIIYEDQRITESLHC